MDNRERDRSTIINHILLIWFKHWSDVGLFPQRGDSASSEKKRLNNKVNGYDNSTAHYFTILSGIPTTPVTMLTSSLLRISLTLSWDVEISISWSELTMSRCSPTKSEVLVGKNSAEKLVKQKAFFFLANFKTSSIQGAWSWFISKLYLRNMHGCHLQQVQGLEN